MMSSRKEEDSPRKRRITGRRPGEKGKENGLQDGIRVAKQINSTNKGKECEKPGKVTGTRAKQRKNTKGRN